MASFIHFIKAEREKGASYKWRLISKVSINGFAISKIENGAEKLNKTKAKTLLACLE